MDQADIELRTTIVKCWPQTKRDKIDLLVPPPKCKFHAVNCYNNPLIYLINFVDTGRGKLTVGKLYGGILIHENWRNTKFNQIDELRKQEEELEEIEKAEALAAAEAAAKDAADRGSSYEADTEVDDRKKQMEQDADFTKEDSNYMNEEDIFGDSADERRRQMYVYSSKRHLVLLK